MFTRFNGYANFILVRLNIGRQGDIFPNLIQLDTRAVDCELNQFVFGVTAVQGSDGISNGYPGDLIFAVGRKVMMDEHSAPRYKRQTVDLVFLRVVLPDVVRFPAGWNFVPEGKPAQLGSCG